MYCPAGKNHIWLRALDERPFAQVCCSVKNGNHHKQVLNNAEDFIPLLTSSEWKNKYSELENSPLSNGDCNICHINETTHGESQRLKLLKLTENNKFFLKIDFSNKCNLKCIMCSSLRSTSWIKDEQQMNKNLGSQPWLVKPNTYSTLGNGWWNNIETNWWNNVGSVEISGGEPLYDPDAIAFIDFLCSEYPDIPIRIITNATLVDDNMLSNFRKIKSIQFLCSVDGWEDAIYSYSRGGNISLDTTKDNMLRLREVGIIHIVDVVHALTYDQAPIAKKWIEDKRLDFSYSCLTINEPTFLDPRKVLPKSIYPQGDKDIIQQRIFKQWVTELDKVRGTNIYDVRPEFKSWLDFVSK